WNHGRDGAVKPPVAGKRSATALRGQPAVIHAGRAGPLAVGLKLPPDLAPIEARVAGAAEFQLDAAAAVVESAHRHPGGIDAAQAVLGADAALVIGGAAAFGLPEVRDQQPDRRG